MKLYYSLFNYFKNSFHIVKKTTQLSKYQGKNPPLSYNKALLN